MLPSPASPRILLGLGLGFVGVVIFGATLPMTRLAVAALDPWFVTFGRAGVAVLSREQPSAIRTEVGLDGMDGLGRWIEVDRLHGFLRNDRLLAGA